MKKLLLFCVAIALCASPLLAQGEVDWEARGGMFYDFENDTASWTAFSCSSEDGQIFGQYGLDHGPAFAHGKITGLATS